MKRPELAVSHVVFDADAHTYTLDDKTLQGITGMLSRQLFPNKYADVPEFVLKRAAARGTSVHEEIQMADEGFAPAEKSVELQNYLLLKEREHLETLANEYLVSDEQHFASCIDLVFVNDDGSVTLTDIKTTYAPDVEYVRWQLSIYARLFELMNPDVPIRELRLLWLRGEKIKYETVERVPSAEIDALLACEVKGEQYKSTIVETAEQYPAAFIDAQRALVDVEQRYAAAKAEREALTAGLLTLMQEYGIKSFKGDRITLTRRLGGVRETLDTTALRRDFPELCAEYTKRSETKESLTIKLNP